MYTEGIKIGDDTYLLLDECNNVTLINGSSNTEETEEYVNLNNECDKKIELRNNLQKNLSTIHRLDNLSKKWNIRIILGSIFIESFILLIGSINIVSIVIPPTLFITGTLVMKRSDCLTKKKRKKLKLDTTEELSKVNEELEEITKKLKTLEEKIENETYLEDEKIIPVSTVENKKSNIKMRVLKLK